MWAPSASQAHRSRPTSRVAEDDAALGAIGRECRDERQDLRHEEQKSIDDDAAACVPGQLDVGLGRQQAEEIDRQAARDVVLMERPDILDSDRIGKHRTIAVHLQLVSEPDDDEEDRPADPGGDD